jgi:hypothetical protein
MVILSTGDHAELPSAMKEWLDEWTSQRDAEEGALVAIFNRAKGPTPPRNGIRDHLAEIAQQLHMDFFSSEAMA